MAGNAALSKAELASVVKQYFVQLTRGAIFNRSRIRSPVVDSVSSQCVWVICGSRTHHRKPHEQRA